MRLQMDEIWPIGCSSRPPDVVTSHEEDAHVSLVKTHQSRLLHCAGSTDGSVSGIIACVRSRSAGPTATPTAAAATASAATASAATATAASPYTAASAAAGGADCTLSRCIVGTGVDRINLSARSNIGGALG